MDKKSPLFTASAASVLFFIILLMLEYLLSIKGEGTVTVDWHGALFAALVFWIVIFVLHQYLNRRYS